MRKIMIALMVLTYCLFAQDINEIKKSDIYIWGQGESTILRKADKRAIDDLISQISVQVESQFTDVVAENDGDIAEYTKSMLTTYSSTILNGALRKVDEGHNKTTVLRYIKKDNLDKLFANRRNKIIDYSKSALLAEKELRIGDALKYYYWSLVLLRSHPDNNSISMSFPNEGNRMLITAIPDRIDRIFTFLNITPKMFLIILLLARK